MVVANLSIWQAMLAWCGGVTYQLVYKSAEAIASQQTLMEQMIERIESLEREAAKSPSTDEMLRGIVVEKITSLNIGCDDVVIVKVPDKWDVDQELLTRVKESFSDALIGTKFDGVTVLSTVDGITFTGMAKSEVPV